MMGVAETIESEYAQLLFNQKGLCGNGKEPRLVFGFDSLRIVGTGNRRIRDVGRIEGQPPLVE